MCDVREKRPPWSHSHIDMNLYKYTIDDDLEVLYALKRGVQKTDPETSANKELSSHLLQFA